MSATIQSTESDTFTITTASGEAVTVEIRMTSDGTPHLVLSGVNCDLEGDAPGSYLLVS